MPSFLERPVHNAYRSTPKGESIRMRIDQDLTVTASE